MNKERWLRLMWALAFGPNEPMYRTLERLYGARGRYYHTADHISACLALFDGLRKTTDCADEIELALWFHDAVYNPLWSRNEEKSARLAEEFMAINGASASMRNLVRRMILATRDHRPDGTPETNVLLDIDLAILSSDPGTYSGYELGIRAEYWFVPSFIYRRTRASLLENFLRRDRIYQTEYMRERESRARANLAASVAVLRAKAT